MASEEEAKKMLGEKLRQAREAAKLTQAEVAERAGVHVNYYARIERGEENPTFTKLQGVMRVLAIKSLDLS